MADHDSPLCAPGYWSSEVSPGRAAEVTALLEQTWWAQSRSLADMERCMEFSTVNLGLEDARRRLIAFVRAQSDTVYKAHLYDVVVARNLRGTGTGRMLLTAILAHPLIASCEHVELHCKPEVEEFYGSFGFERADDIMGFMRRVNPERGAIS